MTKQAAVGIACILLFVGGLPASCFFFGWLDRKIRKWWRRRQPEARWEEPER